MNHKGLGDTVHYILVFLGIPEILRWIGITYCGCSYRRDWLNDLIDYRYILSILQGSGPISLDDINVELGRSAGTTISLNTAESGGYGAINQNSGSKPDGSNPNQMSEWYSYDHNAFTVNFYASTDSSIAGAIEVSYRVNAGSWVSKNTTVSSSPNTPSLVYTFSVSNGDTVDFAIRTTGAADAQFGSATSIPAGTTGKCGRTTPHQSGSISANYNAYLNAAVSGSALVTC